MKKHLSRQSPSSPAAHNRARVRRVAEGAVIAALYVALTWASNLLGLANSAIQIRLSEALCILPYFTPSAISGLWVGCLLANLSMGGQLWDIIFGSLATLLGALGARALGVLVHRLSGKTKRENPIDTPAAVSHQNAAARCPAMQILRFFMPFPTVLANTLIIPPVLVYAYGMEGALPLFMLSVGVGEVLSAWFLGLILLFALERKSNRFTP